MYHPSAALAKVCFLPDCNDNTQNINIDINIESRKCEKLGYYLTCPNLTAPSGKTCKYDEAYNECTKQAWCKENNFNITSCSKPQYPSEQCDNLEPYYKSCIIDNAHACTEIGYAKNCASRQKLYADQRCSWDTSFGKCCSPKACPTYTSLSGTFGDSGTNDGCGYACKYTCNPNCPSGTSETNPVGCAGSTKNSCGNKTCYSPYKACCTPTCTNYTGGCPQGTYQIYNGCDNYCTKCMNIQTGSIYHSDGAIDTTVIPGKTPIAVVANPSNRIIIALHDCTSPTSFSRASSACNSYTTENTRAGSWYIPDLQTLKSIYSNKNILNTAFKTAGGDSFSSWDSSKVYWSNTTQSSDGSPYGLYFSSGTSNPIDPSHSHFSRAVKRF